MGTDWLKVVACFPVSAGREASTGDLRLEKKEKKEKKRKEKTTHLLCLWNGGSVGCNMAGFDEGSARPWLNSNP